MAAATLHCGRSRWTWLSVWTKRLWTWLWPCWAAGHVRWRRRVADRRPAPPDQPEEAERRGRR